MRRWLLIFLMAVLPLQLSWVAVSVYSMHQTDATANHIGHHDHRHSADAGGTVASDPAKSGGGDTDCGACHAGCCLMPLDITQILPLFAAADNSLGHRALYPTLALDRPDRPNWLSHA